MTQYFTLFLVLSFSVFAKDKPPLIGKIIIGSNAVTAIGTGSNIHHIAIQDTEANIAFAESDNPCG
jgi:hypothetical protein